MNAQVRAGLKELKQKGKKDSLGDRMKDYENRSRIFLPRRTYTLFRIDGKAFHSYTKGCDSPYDEKLMHAMDTAAIAVAMEAMGCKLAYVQSDEISGVLTDFETHETQAWFNNNLQKMSSIAASTATIAFYMKRLEQGITKPAKFDARFWTVSDRYEAMNMFVWRQQDAIRNAKQALGQSIFSAKELHGVNVETIVSMAREKGIEWESMNKGFRFGRLIYKQDRIQRETVRHSWVSTPAPIFSEDGWNVLDNLIPKLPL